MLIPLMRMDFISEKLTSIQYSNAQNALESYLPQVEEYLEGVRQVREQEKGERK